MIVIVEGHNEKIEWEKLEIKKIRDTKGTFYAKMGTIRKWYRLNRSRRDYEEVARIYRTIQKRC